MYALKKFSLKNNKIKITQLTFLINFMLGVVIFAKADFRLGNLCILKSHAKFP